MRGKAEAAGVKSIYIDDLREEFVQDYVFPMFRCAPLSTFPLLLHAFDCIHCCIYKPKNVQSKLFV